MHLNAAISTNQNERTVSNWLKRLPISNVHDCGKQLIEIHYFIQKNESNSAIRLSLQRKLFDNTRQWISRLEYQFSENACNHTALKLARMGSKVLTHNLEALQQDLKTTLQKRQLLSWRRRARQQLVLAMEIAQRYVCFALRCHVDLSPAFWLSTHFMYYTASQHGWLARQLPSGMALQVGYQYIQLLGIIDGKHLSAREIEAAISWAQHLASMVRLHVLQSQPPAPSGHIYLLDLTRGAPPQFLLYTASLQHDEHCLSFDLEYIIAMLAQHASGHGQGPKGISSPALSAIVAQTLAEALSSPRRRRHSRQSIMQSMALISQMRAIRQVLGVHQDWQALRGNQHNRQQISHIAIFRALNKSDSGLLLRGNPGYQSLKIGELLLIADQLSKHGPLLYTVRWTAVSTQSNEISCGAELIGSNPEAVDVIPMITHPHEVFQPALCLHAGQGNYGSSLLIVPGQPYSHSREFRLRDQRGEHRVKVTRVRMQTALYQAMEFQHSLE